VSRLAARTGLQPKALLGLAVLVGGMVLWVLAFTGGLSNVFGSSTSTIRADFASVEDIVPTDPVRINGVQVGTVSGESMDPGGRGATLTMTIDTSDPIYANASASILWRTVLGANDAVSLEPGTRSAGLLGSAEIPQSRDSNQVELDQITAAVHGGAQSGIRTMLAQLSPALADHPALAQGLSKLAQVAPDVTSGVGAVRGQIQDTDLKNLVSDAARTAHALNVGTGASQTRQFVESAANTLSAVSANPAALKSSIRLLTILLPLAHRNFTSFNRSLNLVDPLIAKLTPVAPQVAPTLAGLHPAVVNLNTLLRDARPLFNKLSPTVDSVAKAARAGVPVINSVSPSLKRLSNKILPGLNETTPETRGHPAYTLIGSTFVDLGTLSGFVNTDGELANLTLGLGAANDTGGLLPCQVDFSGTDLLVCNTLSQSLATLFTGGTSLLSSLITNPLAASVYSPLLAKAKKLQNELSATRKALQKKAPAVAKYVFEPNHGNAR